MPFSDRSWASQDVLWELGASFIDATAETAAPVVESAIARIGGRLNALSIGVWAIDSTTMSGHAVNKWSIDEWADVEEGFLARPDPAVRDAVMDGGGLAVVELEMVVGVDLAEERGWRGGYALVAVIDTGPVESVVLVVASADNAWDERDLELIQGAVTLLRQFHGRLRVEEKLHTRLRLDDLTLTLASRFQNVTVETIDGIIDSSLHELRDIMGLESVTLIDVVDDSTIEIPTMVARSELPAEFRRLLLPDISAIPGGAGMTLREYVAEPKVIDLVELVDAILGVDLTESFGLNDRPRTVALLPASVSHGDSLLAAVRVGDADWDPREFDALSTLASLIAQTRARVGAERASRELLEAQRALVSTGKVFLEADGGDASEAIRAALERMAAHMGADLAAIEADRTAVTIAESWARHPSFMWSPV